MLNKAVIITLLLILVGCDDPAPVGYKCQNYSAHGGCTPGYAYKYVCQQEKRSKFIIECARAANPMSDEEGEDLVRQCDETSKDIFCTIEPYKSEKNK